MAITTTLKLPEDIKERIAAAAEVAGKTPHAYMIDALSAQTALDERRRALVQAAHLAEQEVVEYGLVYDADEVFSHIQAKTAGKSGKRPQAKKLK